jgi:hypothetical protein
MSGRSSVELGERVDSKQYGLDAEFYQWKPVGSLRVYGKQKD